MARIPPKTVSADDEEVLRHSRRRAEARRLRPGQGDRGARLGDQARARRPARAGEADRLLPVRRPDRRRQDRGRQAARRLAGRRAHPLRHVGVHGAAHRLAADRRAAGLCRLRPGRPADRRRRPASALRAAARRDREGASGPVQHPAAGDGSRQADRPQRQAGRLPQRHPDHDDQCRRGRHGQGRRSASARPSATATTRRRSTACSRRSSATVSTRSSRSPRCRRRSSSGGAEVRAAAGGAAGRPRRHLRPVAGCDRLAGREGLRRAHGRAAAGPRDPGAHQAAARRRGAVRQAARRAARCASRSRRRRPARQA